ncbi:MAG: protease modulator HflK [Gemmatales bacterium]|nr:protease modulator HflK [Gemmatales bacterium]MDW8387383.1 protease modulator HflK [Gemmatales bacterium]
MTRWFLPAVLLLALGYLATGIYQVKPGELAVVRRFGRVLEEPRLPGLNVGLPWGLDRVDRIAVDSQRQIEIGFHPELAQPERSVPVGQLLTGDNNLIDVRISVYYRVDRQTPGAVADYVLNADRVLDILPRAAEAALSRALASERVDAVLLGQAAGLESRIQEMLSAEVRQYRLGIVIESVNLTYVQPPAELAEAFRQVNRARTQKEITEREALGASQIEISSAQQQARRIVSDAQASARDRVRRAEAEATAFLALLEQYNPHDPSAGNLLLTLYLKELQNILSRVQIRTLSDADTDYTVVLPGGSR